MKLLRSAAMILIALSLPVSLFTLGWGLVLIIGEAGLVVGAICAASLITVSLGTARLIDKRHPPCRMQSDPRCARRELGL